MSDKLNFSTQSLGRLASYSLLVLEGPDAVAFIQAQSMNDVNALGDGQWHWNGLLNPKGRLIALFALVRIRKDMLYILSPDFPAEKLCLHLQRYVFRSKVQLTANPDSICFAELDSLPTTQSSRNTISGSPENGMALDFSSDTQSRRLLVLPMQLANNIQPNTGVQSVWRDADIEHGLPRLSEAQSEQWTPQMLSLGNLHAFSLKKGCYPGQEIVARTHYLGQAKRQTFLVQSENLAMGAAIYAAGEKAGEVLCITSRSNMGLALISSTAESGPMICGENEVKLLQALTGLQRPI